MNADIIIHKKKKMTADLMGTVCTCSPIGTSTSRGVNGWFDSIWKWKVLLEKSENFVSHVEQDSTVELLFDEAKELWMIMRAHFQLGEFSLDVFFFACLFEGFWTSKISLTKKRKGSLLTEVFIKSIPAILNPRKIQESPIEKNCENQWNTNTSIHHRNDSSTFSKWMEVTVSNSCI